MSEPTEHIASVYVEYSLRSHLSPDLHLERNCQCVSPTGSEVLVSPEECAKQYLDTLSEGDRQLCKLAEQAEDKEVGRLLRSTLEKRQYKTESDLAKLLYKIWYKVLRDGASAGCVLSCISVCGMVATMACEMGIPANNLAKSLDEILSSRKSTHYWKYIKGTAIQLLFYLGTQFVISAIY